MDLVEDGDRDGDSDHPVFPDPLILDVELHRELRDLGAERVGELHGATRGVRHRDDWLSDGRIYTHYYVMLSQLTYLQCQSIIYSYSRPKTHFRAGFNYNND